MMRRMFATLLIVIATLVYPCLGEEGPSGGNPPLVEPVVAPSTGEIYGPELPAEASAEILIEEDSVLADGARISGADIILVLDNSGSMKKNDPGFLTHEIVSRFAERLAGDSSLEVILFGADVEVALPFTSAAEIDFSQRVEDVLPRVNYEGQLTNLAAAVERALYDLRVNHRESASPAIVILTDGVVDVGDPVRDLEQKQWMKTSLAAQAHRAGVRLFGVAFTDAADFELMQHLAQATSGEYFRAPSVSDVETAFESISTTLNIDRAAGREMNLLRWAPSLIGGVLALGLAALALLQFRRPTRVPSVAASAPGVSEMVPTAILRGTSESASGLQFRIDRNHSRVGRVAIANDIVIDSPTVSGQHALVEYRDGSFYVRDLCSRNGSYLNGTCFSDPDHREIRAVGLNNHDRVRFDEFEFEFVVAALEDVDETRVVIASEPDSSVTHNLDYSAA